MLKSFVKGADGSFFPLENLPYGVFYHPTDTRARIGVAIGAYVLDLALLEEQGLFPHGHDQSLFNHDCLNYFAARGPKIWTKVRTEIQSLLHIDNKLLQDNHLLLAKALIPANDVVMMLPFKTQGYSDFYTSEQHATNVGRLFRGNECPLLPNWKFLPIGYHGRASTLFVSGTPIRRPKGQIKLPDQEQPIFSPTRKLDFELEMGTYVGVGNPDGTPIPVNQAHNHIFGLVLLNDWSARDIQAFEYQPLGPFLSKSFATSISPWVVPLAALKEFMTPLAKQVPEPVAYLQQDSLQLPKIKLRVELQAKGEKQRTLLTTTTYDELYWSMEQLLAHHTVNNCIMTPGDLLGSGTISGRAKENWGSLLEITFNGKEPVQLNNGKTRAFLEDGDSIIFTGFCEAKDYKIGFGECEGTIIAG